MLNLTRKLSETVILELEDGRQIRVMVTRIAGEKIGLGFDCARTINIFREEVFLQVQEERAESPTAVSA